MEPALNKVYLCLMFLGKMSLNKKVKERYGTDFFNE